ncbi:hypothetical protein FRC05_009815 [Tulasnella sp. 425]|nr:hypothetical protein FRC05_009815 [Tulasnella sp. 425]
MTDPVVGKITDVQHCPQGSSHLQFSQLAVDIVHSIFRLFLQLDRIHDYDVPFEDLGELRKQVYCLRCVSTPWNEFILSSPQYWCVINIRAPQAAMVRSIERAQTAPLCVYSTKAGPWKAVHFDQTRPMLVTRLGQIRTLRLDDQDLYGFGLSLIRPGLPNLKTLEILPRSYPHFFERPPTYDMPKLCHLSSSSWRPPSDATWIQGLKTLVLRGLEGSDSDLYRILDQCAHGLRKLSLELGSSWRGLPHAHPVMAMPLLEELRLDIGCSRVPVELLRKIIIPQSACGIIRESGFLEDVTIFQDLLDFLVPAERSAINREPAMIEVSTEELLIYAQYTNGNRTLLFEIPYTDQEAGYEMVRQILQPVHLRLRNPVISATVFINELSDTNVLRVLHTSNVQSLTITSCYLPDMADVVTAAIGIHDPDNLAEADADAGDWPFQSLRYFAIDCDHIDGDISGMVRVITTRQECMKAHGSVCLEEVVISHCHDLPRMAFSDVARELGVVGIIAREEQSPTFTDFQISRDIL